MAHDTSLAGDRTELEIATALARAGRRLLKPMSSAAQVAEAVMRCIVGNEAEIALPALSGKLATVGYVFPSVAAFLRPLLERRGAAAKASYLERKRSEAGST